MGNKKNNKYKKVKTNANKRKVIGEKVIKK